MIEVLIFSFLITLLFTPFGIIFQKGVNLRAFSLQLIYGLINSFQILPIGGVLVVVTFHSIEDKIVKFFFKNYSENKNTSRYLPDNNNKKKLIFKLDKKKPIYPSKEETKINPSSRSAKLRYAIKINNNKDFKSFVDKFKFYLNLEDLDKNL